MSKLLTNDRHKENFILNYLLEKIADNNIDIASPFVSQNDLLKKIINNKNKTRLIVKIDNDAKFELLKSLLEKGHFDIKFFIEDFHAKYYRIQDEIIVGSSNFMSSSLRSNKEINIVVGQDDTLYQELLDTFESYWNEAKPLNYDVVEFGLNNATKSRGKGNKAFREKLENFLEANKNNGTSGKELTDEHKRKIGEANSKPVILINSFQYFDSMQIAAEKIYGYKRGYGYISAVCKGQKKHYKRKTWMFEDDFRKLPLQEQEKRKEEALKLEEGNIKIKEKEYYIYKNKIYKTMKDLSIQLHNDGHIDKLNKRKVENWNRSLSSRLIDQKQKSCPFLRFGDEYIFFGNYYLEYQDDELIEEVPEEEELEEVSKKYGRILDINIGDLTVSELLNSESIQFYKYDRNYFKSQKSIRDKYKEFADGQIQILTKDDIISELEPLFEDMNFKN